MTGEFRDHVQLPDKPAICASSNETELNGWHVDAYDIFDHTTARIEAFRLAGTATEDWLRRTASLAALAKIVMRRVERRLLELNLDPPQTRDGYERDIIRVLKSKVRSLEQQLRRAKDGAGDE